MQDSSSDVNDLEVYLLCEQKLYRTYSILDVLEIEKYMDKKAEIENATVDKESFLCMFNNTSFFHVNANETEVLLDVLNRIREYDEMDPLKTD